MITQYDVPEVLKQGVPALELNQFKNSKSLKIYSAFYCFSDHTRHLLQHRDYAHAKECFVTANRLYNEGDSTVRRLIENIFIYSFSLFPSASRGIDSLTRAIIPEPLYRLYLRQIHISNS